MVLYSILHAALGLSYFIQPDLIQNNQYFSLNSTNIIFYIVLSIVYLAVSIYNLGYSKNEAIKMIAKDKNVTKRDIYDYFKKN